MELFRSSKEHDEHVRIEKEKLNKVDMQINLQKQRLDKQDTVIKEFEKASNIGEIGEEEVRVLFDTGANRTFIRSGIAKKIAVLVKLTRPKIAILGDGENKIKITESIFLEISLR